MMFRDFLVILLMVLLVGALIYLTIHCHVFNVIKSPVGHGFALNCPMGIAFNDRSDLLPKIPLKKQICVKMNKYKYPTQKLQKKLKIPNHIYQTTANKKVPISMAEAMIGHQKLNPDFYWTFFRDKECLELLKKEASPRLVYCYQKCIPGAYKADLFRYFLLWQRGGIYLDSGFISLRPLTFFLKSTDTFVSAKDGIMDGVYNAFMCATPKHPILKEVLEIAMDRIEREDYGNGPLYITGPEALMEAFRKVTGFKAELKEGDYGNGIRLLNHYSDPFYCCLSREIESNGKNVFITRYPSYRLDMTWYLKGPRYPTLWSERKAFNKDIV